MSRYLLVAPDFIETGGMDVANHALAEHLARRDDDVHLVTFRASASLRAYANVTVHQAYKPADAYLLGGPFLAAGALLQARRLGPRGLRIVSNGGNAPLESVNWVHYVHAAYQSMSAGRAWRRAKQVVSHRVSVATERRALRAAKVIVANSKRTAQDLRDQVGVGAEKIRVVYLGVDPKRFHPASAAERRAAADRLAWPLDRPRLVFIGALGDRRKGFDSLFRAWATLARQPSWDAELVVVGKGAELPRWQDRAETAGISPRLRFLGYRNDVPDILAASDGLVAPTRYEAYGLGVHEALCCGLPAIVSASAGVAELYPSSLNALLLRDPEDGTELVERLGAWRTELSALREKTLELSVTLRERTWDAVARDIRQICEDTYP